MKKIIFLTTFILGLSILSQATHLVGGGISYEYVMTKPNGDRQYLIKVTVIKDSNSSTVDFDKDIEVGIYLLNPRKDRLLILDMTLTRKNAIKIGCVTSARAGKFHQGTYEKLVDLTPNVTGYMVTWERCCRTISKNLPIASSGEPETPFYFVCQIPGTVNNTSAQFENYITGFCSGKETSTGTSYYDADGDSVVVKLANPIKGNASINQSKPSPTQTFSEETPITFSSGFHYSKPFGINNGSSIEFDSMNLVRFNVTDPGSYYVAYVISEYRNGKFLTSRIVDNLTIGISCSNSTSTNSPKNLSALNLKQFQGKLEWCSCENQVSRYVVYRSKENKTEYDSIGMTSSSSYYFIDSTVLAPGVYYYYVEGIGLPGRESGKTNEVSILYNNSSLADLRSPVIRIYPNPTYGSLTTSSDETISEILVFDLKGVHYKVELNKSSADAYTLKTECLNPGSYIVRIAGTGFTRFARFIKL